MREIRKRWAPANVSPDGQEERSLQEAERDYLGGLAAKTDRITFARAEFDRMDKRRLRAAMYQEQRSICVYCEGRIEEGNPTPRIDHWRPLGIHPELALHWRNLYLSCSARENCETAKGSRALRWDDGDDHMPWPTDLRYEDVVGFTSRGDIYVRRDVNLGVATRRALELAIDDCADGGRTRRAVLNLNHPALVAARAAALDSERTRMKKDFEGRRASPEERARRAMDLEARDPLPPFVGVRLAWLRHVLGRGR